MSCCTLSLFLASMYIMKTYCYPNGSCNGYTALNGPWRNYLFTSTSFPGFPISTDYLLTNQWVRFIGIGGDTIMNECVGTNIGGVNYPIYLSFTQPQTESDTPTQGTACGIIQNCCTYGMTVDVVYCSSGGFYVYRPISSFPSYQMGYMTYHRNCTSSSCGPLAQCSTPPYSGCTCVSGYRIPPTHLPVNESYGCQDIDECVETPNICGSNSNCTNLPGTYNCSCLEGYAPSNPALAFNPSNNPCTDVNECLDIHKACGYYASCTNTPGSHTCTCYTGFQPDGPFNCQDIDECLNSTICGPNSVCNNTPGSYNCSCLIGFTPQNSNAQQPSKTNPCIDIDECLNSTICGPNGNCTNTYGSYRCTCFPGYQPSSPVTIASPLNPCKDIDECAETPGLCGLNSVCNNAPGSFFCFCGDGYYSSTGLLWKMDISVCEKVDSILAAIVPLEGQTKEMQFLHQMNQQLLDNPNIVLPAGCVTNGLFAVMEVSGVTTDPSQKATNAQDQSAGPGQDGGAMGSAVLGVSEHLVNSLVDPTEGQTNKTIQTSLLAINVQVVYNNNNSTYSPSLTASENYMDINLQALARQNNGTASAVFMTVIGMENILSASFFSTPNNTEMFSDIVTATLPKINHTQLSEPVNFTMSHKRRLTEPGLMTCVYWDDNGTDEGNQSWSVDGCWVSYSDENYTVCSCSHLSTFALIMQTIKTDAVDNPFLDLVNNVCVVVGLVFLALAILTFLLCNWNPKINNTARLHLCICLFLCQLFFLLKYTYVNHKLVCSVMAGLLHFLVVASFMWMLLEALQLHQLVRRLSKIQVIQRDGLQKKYLYLIGYGIPLVIVGVSVAVRPDGYGGTTVCWLKPDKSFTWASLGPVCVILAMNWIVFCVTIWSLRPTLASMKSDVSQSKDTRLIIFKILAQFVILGCTWVLGLFQSTIFFKYLFIVLNSQQGTFLYIVHCLFNQEVRNEYRKWLGCTSNAFVQDSMKETPTVSEDLNKADEQRQKKGTT